MFLDTDSIKVKVGSGSYVSMGQYLIEAKYSYNKLWSSDSGRNLAGKQSGTLIGIFPKIQMEVGYTTQEEMSELTQLLDRDFFTVTWFDVRTQETFSAEYYASDYDVELDNKSKGRYKPFSVSLVPVSKRRY